MVLAFDVQAAVKAAMLLSFIFRRVLEDSPAHVNLGRAPGLFSRAAQPSWRCVMLQ